MWKIALGFAVFAALAMWMLSQGGDVDMGGEKHGIEVSHEAPASAPVKGASAPAAVALPASAASQ